MDDIAKGLRQEGYTPKAFPKVAGAIEELTSTAQPKDWTELQALRKMIRSGQKSIYVTCKPQRTASLHALRVLG